MNGWDPNDAPLYAELLRYAARKEASFHVPGHKDGNFYRDIRKNIPSGFKEVLGIDVTEIEGTDDLHDPEGVIKEAQEKAAAFFGAEETFFLIGGSTAGNLALILTVCREPGDLLIVQRNVHKSVLNGLMLAGARAVFVAPDPDPESGLAVLPGDPTLEEALQRYPEARGVLLTRPNYYGMGRSIRKTADICHRHGVPLLVDEAHGAHYGLHTAFPISALAEGADGVVQSTHKMLAAMTMGAMLHVQGGRLDRSLLRRRLAMVQSSSPSYPIMASLDLARSIAQSRGEDAWTGALEAAAYIRRELERLPRFGYVRPKLPDGCSDSAAAFECCAAEPAAAEEGRGEPFGGGAVSAYAEQDPLKIAVYDRRRVLSGYAMQQRLAAAGCIAEMSDERRTVLALGPGSGMNDAERLISALRELQCELDINTKAESVEFGSGQHEALESRDAVFRTAPLISDPVPFDLRPPRSSEPLQVEEAAGRIAAEMIVPYPPGIPLIYAGERITKSAADHLIRLRKAGARFQGAADGELTTIQVRRKEENDGSIHNIPADLA
ncbi:aminotransferase class I/II-fold pyridoxal phosphate-dependent enzyme [Saccharibacillus kuerlensis]|uniref:Lysine decarboxylase n=1 Tax=Saccharibacillus kuerlensis TaxID=459527 RepID=A0ABQ2LB33_9BACL|nr:aminotransferase class I/II-fold pyridoxal phosphate-dependent enzyme [Saccharibacillus kuerlensis]GGO09076.1 lysine decarboxylase [Saccharibacillus kuerlensis]